MKLEVNSNGVVLKKLVKVLFGRLEKRKNLKIPSFTRYKLYPMTLIFEDKSFNPSVNLESTGSAALDFSGGSSGSFGPRTLSHSSCLSLRFSSASRACIGMSILSKRKRLF